MIGGDLVVVDDDDYSLSHIRQKDGTGTVQEGKDEKCHMHGL